MPVRLAVLARLKLAGSIVRSQLRRQTPGTWEDRSVPHRELKGNGTVLCQRAALSASEQPCGWDPV